ncbi:3-oxoacyl-ACP synthase [Candidatus Protochlamydia naegleriophila]|uniref:Beta-ketoacyl-[acyl-carrier-protein] synthase III n=1 Tax=Candidatus Protochlamydia naegleriophila TaxID=389348 RepID=A0A0U5JF65_9BACT|nr:beta-ketoacyl-ACP synthase III [Candidatus Protochlamydia naegleriophila]CUI16533.1 3-oxoacyl-ACP synthase [Candidatus Protochlamydia naegleriophila]
MANRLTARITGLGSYLPERILTNQDLEKLVETTNEWIVSRTGMHERRLAAKDEFPSDMGAYAAQKALDSAGIGSDQIDMIIVATMSPDYVSPSTANLIQSKIGASKAAAMDIQAACTGFLYALSLAKAYLESKMYKYILVVAAEKMSAFIDYKDRATCVLFGDGAAAAVVAVEGEGLRIDTLCLGADGDLANLIFIPAGGSRNPASAETVAQGLHYFKMSGNEVFKHAVRRMSAAARDCLAQAGLEEANLSWLVPHQANKRIIDAIAKNFNIPDEKVYQTVHKYGNTSASSIAIALDELMREQEFNDGEHLLLTAFGGGLTWGASILTKVAR